MQGRDAVGIGRIEGRAAGEGCRQGLGIHFADVADAQAVELAVPRLLFGLAEGLHQIGRRFFTHSFQARQQGTVQPIEVGNRVHQPPFHQLFDQLAAQAVHIEGPFAHPVAQATAQDRRAAAVDAAGRRFIAFPHQP